SPGPRTTVPGEAVILHLTEPIGVSLKGQVPDPVGRPIAGASVHLRAGERAGLGAVGTRDEPVAVGDGPMLVPAAHGGLRTPPDRDGDRQYGAFAAAPGYLTSRTLWTAGHAGAFEVIRLRPAS